MSVIGNFISGLNQQRMGHNYNSVEGLIRATLGNRFIETPITENKEVTNILPPPEEIDPVNDPVFESEQQILNEVLSTPVTEDLPKKKEKIESLSHFGGDRKKQATKGEKESEFPTFKKAIRDLKESYQYEEEYQEKPVFSPPPQPKAPPPPVRSDENDYSYEAPKTIPIKRKNEYIFHRDTDETFECVVTVEGGSSENTISRLILKTDMWNIVFDGVIKKNGTCEVPLKKLSLFPDGTTGKAYLEIVVDDVVFVPWESPFRVSTSKKVTIQSPILNRR